MNSFVAWMNGQLLPFSEMALPVWDLGVVAGASITEMARTFNHRAFRLPDHINRLLNSCSELGFSAPYSPQQLLNAAEEVVAANESQIAASDDLGIVIFITAGANRTYLGAGELPGPTVGIHTFRLPFEIWQTACQQGVRLAIPDRIQISTASLPVESKTRNRLHWWLADKEADAKLPGAKALLLDTSGFITETSTSCFYGVIAGSIVTPQANVLNSMSRRMVKEAAAEFGIPLIERNLQRSDINNMTEVFTSSTPVGLLPVRSIDDRQFPVNSADSLVPKLLTFWQHQTGICLRQQILKHA